MLKDKHVVVLVSTWFIKLTPFPSSAVFFVMLTNYFMSGVWPLFHLFF